MKEEIAGAKIAGRAPALSATPKELLFGTQRKKKLNQWLATGICGNDITSSCLYVAGIAAVYAGILAPVVLLLICFVLYLYKKVYTEVVEALPLNGGTYNCLLNCTSKFAASVAACLTILSYIATAVISAKTGMEYLHQIVPEIHVIGATIGILALFAILAIIGITESAVVALTLFIFHMATLTVVCLVAFFSIPADFSIFQSNLGTLPASKDLPVALVLGFSAALLGVSGFESSANFVEEQDLGVFRKTLRNMLIAVLIFNPLLSIISLNLMPLADMVSHKDYVLSELACRIGGNGLQMLVVLDAAAVLSGAVLTGFVGVTGLIHRMALDQCLPRFFLTKNRRGTHHRIIITFFLLCSSILIVTKGNLLSLAGVYTISFLGVMTLFGLGNILLKLRRKELKRTYRAPWVIILIAMISTCMGMVGNVILDYYNLVYFLYYFVPTVLLVIIVYMRIPIMRAILELVNELMVKFLVWRTMIIDRIMELNEQRVVLFVRSGRLHRMLPAFQYIVKNETSRSVVLLHLYNSPRENDEEAIKESLKTIQALYPNLKIEMVVREGKFGPETLDSVSREFGVEKNNIFIGAPEAKHPFSIQDLGGVRVIF